MIIAAEIWRMGNEKVTELFVEPNKVVSIELEARRHIADADHSNNAFPQRVSPSRSEGFPPESDSAEPDGRCAVRTEGERTASFSGRFDPAERDAAMKATGRKLTRRLAIAGACALAVARPAFAHRSQSVLTTINWNAATSTLEVMHRIHAHDAEVGLMRTAGLTGDVDITVARNQAHLMLYVEKHFTMSEPNGPIALAPLGAELQSEAIVLYREAKLQAPPSELAIEDQILRDVFDQQTNLVNVKLDRKTRTLIFSGRDRVKQAKDLL